MTRNTTEVTKSTEEEHGTIEITISEGCPRVISKKILTANSSVFTHLIQDLALQQIEIEDFDHEIVLLFLALLSEAGKDKKVGHVIEEREFRELHKIAVAFNVEWLIKHCRNWLEIKINGLAKAKSWIDMLDQCLFVYKECLYIYDKWESTWLMETLIIMTQTRNDDS